MSAFWLQPFATNSVASQSTIPVSAARLASEVLARFDESAAEDLLPQPIHGDPGDQRVVLVDQPVASPSRLTG